jgi:LacI family transcriptional regulator
MNKPTLKSISNKLGISSVAVFKALNNQSGVSEVLRRKIKAYAKTIGYVGMSSGQGLNNKRFMFFVNQDFFLTPSEQFYSSIFYFLSSECINSNCILQVFFVEPNHPLEKLKNTITAFDPDGIFYACQVSDQILKYIEDSIIPSIIIDYYSPQYACNYVYVDNYQVSYQLTKYLIEKGHQRIGFVGDINKTASVADRYFGFQKALLEAGLTFDPTWHINENIEHRKDILELPLGELPTAFICHCDSAAQRLYTTFAVKGIIIPDQVSVISFDNTSLAESLMPRLTSVGPQKDNYAKKAMAGMLEAIKNKHISIQVKSHLSERESVSLLK